MTSLTNEQALESTIEKSLTGTSREELRDNDDTTTESFPVYSQGHGYLNGIPDDFNPKYAVDEKRFWHFLESTQKEELEKIQRSGDWKLRILERYDRMIKKYGILRLMRKGLDIEDAHFTLLYQIPMASSSQAVKDHFESNEFSVTRQVRYNLDHAGQEIDMVLFVNGLPVATLELKNPWTGQNAKVHGIRQYKQDRDPNQPLLNYGRCLVHFAVDTDEVYMTTRLNREKTNFLPFNKGYHNGKGNPSSIGHKTRYLWEEVFTRESLANIIQHFVRFDGKANDPITKRTLYFPRYHQLDVVRKLITDIRKKGVGKTYLIQHSAGSGKSNSITWSAYQLIEVYPERADLPGAKDLQTPLFDSVVVVTDRTILDRQLRENIKEFSEVKNIVAPAYSARDLKNNLEQGKKIIITTIQKFPFIVEGIADLTEKRFAVIIDEAHSSQSGTTADKMNAAMGNGYDEDEEDTQDKILRAMRARKMKGNASYLAFTATPKPATLEKFGVQQEDKSFKPFHLYSMKQAIEEGFILDVLTNYTTYKSYYEIEKSIRENPLFDVVKAQKRLRAFVERDPRTIGTKAEIMMEHFINKVFVTKKLKGKAKGMVITQNIESAVRYYQAIRKILKAQDNPFKVAIAFSGKKLVDGVEYTESGLNGFSDSDTRKKFDTDDFRILVVANKYLTGFDQPKLCTMYVDKKLQGVMAVQALSRLNRSSEKYGKKTEDLFILDFFNTTDEIKKAFEPFYTSTILTSPTDINVLHELKGTLDVEGVYEWKEVESFADKFFSDVDAQELSPIVDAAASRFNMELGLEEEQKADYKIKAKQFVKIYGQVASIIPYEIPEWEKLFWFLKFLIPKLNVKSRDKELIDDLLESVDLSTYGLQRTKINQTIALKDDGGELKPQNPNPRGVHGGDSEKDLLDEIIRVFNERWFQGWDVTPEDQRIKFITIGRHIKAHPDFKSKVAENKDYQNRELAFRKILIEVMAGERKKELDLYKLFVKDEAFHQAFVDTMRRIIEKPEFVKMK